MDDLMGYFLIGFIMIGVIAILYLPIFFLLKKRVTVIRQLCFILLAGCSFIVLFATIFLALGADAFHPSQRHINLIPFRWISAPWKMSTNKMFVQTVANIIMFIPFGFLIPIVFSKVRTFWRTALIAFFITFLIETFQYFIGRSADIDDLILNLMGGMLGYAIFTLLTRCFQHKSWWLKALGSMK